MSNLSDFYPQNYTGLSISTDVLQWQKSLAELTLDSTSAASASTPALNLKNAKTGVGNGGLMRFYAQNATPTSYLAATIKGMLAVNTAAAESGQIDLTVPKANVSKTVSLRGDHASLECTATGEFTLGYAAARWAGLLWGDSSDTYKGDLSTTAGFVIVQAASAHPLQLKSNGNLGLTIATDGAAQFASSQRITGEFHNSTHSSRTLFKDSASTQSTYVGAVPSSGGTAAGFIGYGTNDPTASGYIVAHHDNSNAIVASMKTGAGTLAPLLLKVDTATGLKVETNGDLTFQSGQRLTGEFHNSTHSSRTLFKDSTSSQSTYVGAVPSSSGSASGFISYGTNDPTASAYLLAGHDNSNAVIQSLKTGGASATPLQLKVDTNAVALSLETNGDIRVGSTTALTTTSTAGFVYMPSVAGIMTGVPTSRSGFVPVMIDTTNIKIGIYTGGAWKWTAALS